MHGYLYVIYVQVSSETLNSPLGYRGPR